MMLKFEDFIPAFIDRGVLGKPKYEELKSVMAHANHWIEQNGVKVVNIETIMMPLPASGRLKTQETYFVGASWMQIVRVWYDL